MTFSQSRKRWIGGPANSPLFVGSAQAVTEPETTADTITRLEASEKYLMDQNIQQRVPIDSQASVGLLLEAILDELRKMNSTPREGAASSCEIKYLAPKPGQTVGTPQPVVKAYAGSEVPVEAAIEAYGRAFLMAQQASLEGWEQTLDVLQAERAARAA